MAAPLRRLVVPVRSSVLSRVLGGRAVPCHRWLHVSRQCRVADQWQLVSAVCLERFPVITQPKNTIEEDFSKLMAKLELEYSHLSDHELRHLEDLHLAERRKSEEYEESDAEVVRQTAVEAEDAWDAELQTFQPASRTTEADAKNDLTSVDRKLDRKLVLLVNQKLGDKNYWLMPQRPRREGESMRQAAEEALRELCGEQAEAAYMGNAPCGFYKYKFPKKVQDQVGAIGAKVFFFKAQLRGGQINTSSPNVDGHMWLTKDELNEYTDRSYAEHIRRFIMEL